MTDLNELPSATLVTIHNDLRSQLPDEDAPAAVKKFSDKKTAVRRVTELLERVNMVRIGKNLSALIVDEQGAIGQEVAVLPTEAPEHDKIVEGPTEPETIDGETGLETADDPEARTVIGPGEILGDEETVETSTETVPEPVDPTPSAETTVTPRAEVKPKKNLGGKPPLVGETDVIILLHQGANPKRALAADRFTHYRTGQTVAEYIAAVGSRKQGLRDIAWDMRQKWIRIVGAAQAEAEIAKLAPPAQPEVEPAKANEPAAEPAAA